MRTQAKPALKKVETKTGRVFGNIGMDVPAKKLDRLLERVKQRAGSQRDTDLTETQLEEIITAFKRIVFTQHHGDEIPQDAREQLRMAITAVFDWGG